MKMKIYKSKTGYYSYLVTDKGNYEITLFHKTRNKEINTVPHFGGHKVQDVNLHTWTNHLGGDRLTITYKDNTVGSKQCEKVYLLVAVDTPLAWYDLELLTY